MKTTQACFRLWASIPIAILLAFNVTSHGQSAVPADAVMPISFKNVPITVAVETLARLEGINYLLDPKLYVKADGSPVPEPIITTDWTNMTVEQALSQVLKEHNLVMVKDPATTIAIIGRTNRIANPVDAKLLGSDTNQTVPISFQDVPIDIALDTLIRLAHLDVTLDPKVTGYVDPVSFKLHTQPTVSIHWVNVTARQAIVALCENYNLVIVKDATTGAIRIKLKE
jgi:hypothetical protein